MDTEIDIPKRFLASYLKILGTIFAVALWLFAGLAVLTRIVL